MSQMEFLSITKFQIPLVSSFVLLTIATTTTLNPVFATKACDFPAIFNFGASNSDTGGLAASLLPLKLPYGETYFHRPVGRFSDGRIIIDFIDFVAPLLLDDDKGRSTLAFCARVGDHHLLYICTQSFGLPYLSAYLDSLGTNFSHGANFATAGSTIRPPPSSSIMPRGRFSPFYLEVQYTQFREFKPRTQFIRHQGGVFATLMPKREYFREALYTFDIGQNDLTAGIFGNLTVQQVKDSVPDIINSFSTNVKNIYNLGARSFWIHNTGPLGCLPVILANFLSAERDSYGCAKPYNEVAQYFNKKLKEALVQLRENLPLAAITYVDIYSPKYSLFQNPKKYGFELPLVSCCGYGGKYNSSNSAGCGGTIKVNGTEIFVGSCERPSHRVIWDGTHYTEAANKLIFDQISTGAFSDPPIPLNMACHRNFTIT